MTDEPLQPVDALDAQAQEEDFDWERFLSSQFATPTDEQQPPVEGEEGQPSPEQEEEGEVPPPPSTTVQEPTPQPDVVTFGDRTLTREQAESLLSLYDFVQNHPTEALQFVEVLEGKAQVVKGAEPEEQAPQFTPPEGEDWEFIPPSLKEKIAKLEEIEQRIAAHEQFLLAQQQMVVMEQAKQAAAAVEQGVERFRSRYDVSDDDLNAIRQEAARLGIADRLLAETGDPVRAVDEALEIAMLRNTELRERQLVQKKIEELKNNESKQRKLAALSGSSGTAPRETGSANEDPRTAMVNAIRSAMSGR